MPVSTIVCCFVGQETLDHSALTPLKYVCNSCLKFFLLSFSAVIFYFLLFALLLPISTGFRLLAPVEFLLETLTSPWNGFGLVACFSQPPVPSHTLRHSLCSTSASHYVSLCSGWLSPFYLIRALKDSNPRHPVLETDVLPTELRTQINIKISLYKYYKMLLWVSR